MGSKQADRPANKPPDHLSEQMKAFWSKLEDLYDLADHHRRSLQLACEAFDRAQQSRQQLDTDGLIVEDRYGQKKTHPAWKVYNDAQNAFRVQLRELGLDVGALPESRPPRRAGTL